MSNKRYKKIKNTIIASASSGLMAGMLLVGGINTSFAESTDGMRTYNVDNISAKSLISQRIDGISQGKNTGEKRLKQKGWRKNVS